MKRRIKISPHTYYYSIYAGVQYDNIHKLISFNFDEDDIDNDVISLCTDTSGNFDNDGVKYIYGYSYNDNANYVNKKILRKYLKDISYDTVDESVSEFIESGVLNIEQNGISFDSIGAIIGLPSRSDLNKIIGMYIHNYTEKAKSPHIQLSLIKEMYVYVDFDYGAARKTLQDSDAYDAEEIEDILSRIKYTFDKKKQTYELFEMKQFVPKEIRKHFSNYLKFRSIQDRKTYMALQGVTAVLYDDFYTSGATVEEAVRYLRAIHNKNRLVVFNLIKQ